MYFVVYFENILVLLWNIQMMGIYFKKYNNTNSQKNILKKKKYGLFLYN